jgi:hypothetical protein
MQVKRHSEESDEDVGWTALLSSPLFSPSPHCMRKTRRETQCDTTSTFLADIKASISSKNITAGCSILARLNTAFISFSPERECGEERHTDRLDE